MRNDTTGKTRGKHYSVADLRRMFEAYERNLCRKNPRPLSQIARELGVPDSSFRDIIARAQTCLPSRFGNKQLQRFPLDMRKLEDNAVKARQRHADAKLFPEAFFHALKPFMSPKGEIAPTTALKDLEAALRDDKNRAEILGKAPGWDGRIPCVKTIYNRITAGRSCAGMDASWLPEKGKRKRVNPSERKGRVAKRCPPGHSILDMPETLLCRQQTFGVWEMDTVHSCRGGKGGLLTLTERQTRKSYAVKLPEISQEAVCAALKKLMRQKKLKTVKALLTDNGSEFLCTAALERIVRAPVYYTYAYSAWQKGSVENFNRQLRRHLGKGTDFSTVSARTIARVEAFINHISRTTSLKGLSANEAFSAIA